MTIWRWDHAADAADGRIGGTLSCTVAAWVAGLILGALLWWLGLGGGQPQATAVPRWQLVVGGFLVGYGSRLGNGCTCGHGICGRGSLHRPLCEATSMGGVIRPAVLSFMRFQDWGPMLVMGDTVGMVLLA